MAMIDGDEAAAKDSCCKDNDEIQPSDVSDAFSVDVRPINVKDDPNRNSPSDGSENDPGTAVGINLQILRRPKRTPADPNEYKTDAPLPVPARVELDVGFQSDIPIPDLPHRLLDASSKSESFDAIRRLFLEGGATPWQEVPVDEDDDNMFASDESGDDVRKMFAVDSLKYFLGKIHLDDATKTSQEPVMS